MSSKEIRIYWFAAGKAKWKFQARLCRFLLTSGNPGGQPPSIESIWRSGAPGKPGRPHA